ncbi:TonB C-terminal domain-containing protein [Undibacterium sp. Di24W]|uniref:TonB C-terminal domain-containing protein n=1 Tax=Undibacterium sp. Di24W TaxID=3413033 RepID=UPI003BF26C41
MRFETIPEEPEEMSDTALANRRLIGGILVSLLLHAIILSLQFGIPGLDLPSLEAPWKERRTAIEPLQIEIANPAPQALPVKPTPSVTTPELFKLPTPVLPAPIPKASEPPHSGIQLVAPLAKVEPVAVKKITKPSKTKAPAATPPPRTVKRVLPPAESPTRIIAQDQVKNDDFVVPLTSEEELQRRAEDKKENKQKAEAIPEDAIIDKNADPDLLAEQKRQDELKKIEQEKVLQEQKREADLQQKKLAQAAKEKLRQQEEQLAQQIAQQKATQEKMAQERLAQETVQRERERAIEEMLRETKRQELLTQETLKQEEQRRQAEQKRLRQLAQEQEQQKQEALAQAQLRQKQQEESEKKRALEIAERKRAEELEAQKLAAQIEQKLQEQRLAEQKVLEQKLAEQRANEQKIAQQKLADQKIAEQKLAEQKQAEQRAAEQKLAEQKALAEATARANAEREAAAATAAANAARLAAGKGNTDSTGQGKGGGNNAAGNANLASSLGKGDLASRLREQARSGDLFKSAPATPSNGKLPDDSRSRRRSFLGAYDKEVPLRMYVDSLKQKMERNGNLIYEKRSLSDIEHNVLINMVIRSDGSIEDVTIMRTSGNRAIDEKARNIIMANAPFSVFPPTLAAKYDVIEIQRVWSFGDRLRILEDLPPSF